MREKKAGDTSCELGSGGAYPYPLKQSIVSVEGEEGVNGEEHGEYAISASECEFRSSVFDLLAPAVQSGIGCSF